jgi:lysophospholipase L1-like esterase
VFRNLLFVIVSCVVVSAAPLKIACVGDSITAGTGLGNSSLESYPARLQRLLGTNNFTIRNFGVSGRTLLKKGDFPYWNDPMFTQSKSFNPDLVIIQLGTNDGKPYNWRYGTNFVSDYKELVAVYTLLPSAPKVYLCTPCPVYGSGNFDIVPGTVKTNIVPLVRSIALELNAPLIDLNGRMTNGTWFPDTVHPSTQGAAVMAAVMFENLFGPPDGPPPKVSFQRLSATQGVVSWPAAWGSLVAQFGSLLRNANTPWILIPTVPYGDGQTIRQTNALAGTMRFYELKRP